MGEYKHTNIPAKPVEVEVTHVEDENHFFASRTGGEVVSSSRSFIAFRYLGGLQLLQ